MKMMVFQCAAACVFGCLGFIANHPHPNPKVPLLWGLLIGFGGSYVATFVVVWWRFGWDAACTMKMDGN